MYTLIGRTVRKTPKADGFEFPQSYKKCVYVLILAIYLHVVVGVLLQLDRGQVARYM